jgi:phage replication O-like protein O
MVHNLDLEDGYLKIANGIAEALMRTNLSAYQSRILWALWRKTYGFNKKADKVSNSQFVELTGLRKQHVSRTIKELKARKIVTNSGYKIAFNKYYQQWRELPIQVTPKKLPIQVTTVTNSGYKSNLYRGPQKTKDNIKDNKEGHEPPKSIFQITLKDKSHFHVSEDDIEEWSAAFPNINVYYELTKLAQWNKDNKSKRKTKTGIRKHIHTWLSKAEQEEIEKNGKTNNGIKKTTEQNWFVYPKTGWPCEKPGHPRYKIPDN